MRPAAGWISAAVCGCVLALAPTPASAADPPPPKGNAMYGLGIASVAFGILNVGYGIPLAITCPGDACFSGYIGIGFGAAFIATGAAAIHFGKRRRAVYRAWTAESGVDAETWQRQRFGEVPPKGVGLLVTGSLSVLIGLAGLSASLSNTLLLDWQGNPVRPPAWAIVGDVFGSLAVVGGATMLGFGGRFAHRYRRWSRGQLTLSPPTPWLLPHGAGLAIAGRF
jgi:hypothetical protein